jgi:hypothetical protein
MAQYNNSSPYLNTDQSKGYLDVISWRTVPAETDDILFTVTASYKHRPDLLAHDLYQDPGLWWVFAQRNPSVLKDPVFDLEPGIQIYLPKLSSMKRTMGI